MNHLLLFYNISTIRLFLFARKLSKENGIQAIGSEPCTKISDKCNSKLKAFTRLNSYNFSVEIEQCIFPTWFPNLQLNYFMLSIPREKIYRNVPKFSDRQV